MEAEREKNLEFWNRVCAVDPGFVKPIPGKSYMSSINPMYRVQKLTAEWGPVGDKWHWQIDYRIISADQAGMLFFVQLDLYTPLGENPIRAYAATPLLQTRINERTGEIYQVLDEEAPKKTLTDALTKAFSYVGESAEQYMRQDDSDKYASGSGSGGSGAQSATSKQLKFLTRLLQELYGDAWEEEAMTQLRKVGLKGPEDLTKDQASAWIEKAKARVDMIRQGATTSSGEPMEQAPMPWEGEQNGSQ